MGRATAGATVGLIAGPSLSSKSPSEPVAAQRGAVVRVDEDSPAVAGAMAEQDPIRVDEIRSADGVRVATVTTEEDRSGDGTAQQMARNVKSDQR